MALWGPTLRNNGEEIYKFPRTSVLKHVTKYQIFYVSQLKLYQAPKGSMRWPSRPEPITPLEGNKEYIVIEIVNHQVTKGGRKTSTDYLGFREG